MKRIISMILALSMVANTAVTTRAEEPIYLLPEYGEIIESMEPEPQINLDVSPAAEDASEFDFNNTNGKITKYNGTSSVVEIPAEIDSIAVTEIATGAFRANTAITKVIIPEGVRTIGDSAFSACTNLSEVVIPSTVKAIGLSAFASCRNLKTITLGEGNQYFKVQEDVLFSADFTKLVCYPAKKANTSYTVPNTVTSIEEYAFAYANNLTSVVLPDSLRDVSNSMFYYNTALESIVIPSGVTAIENQAFYRCSKLKTVSIQENVSRIEGDAFLYCNALETITVAEGNASYKSQDGVLYNKAMTTLLKYPGNKGDTSFSIPDGVQEIGYAAFRHSPNITGEITIPDSVTVISSYAFSECFNVSKITMSPNITTIGQMAFDNCHRLEEITLPATLETIGYYSFQACRSLKEISIPAGVTTIASPFGDCQSLEKITVAPGNSNYKSIDGVLYAINGTIDGSSDGISPKVEGLIIVQYPIKKPGTSFTIPSGVVGIEEHSFSRSEFLEEVIIPDSLEIIGFAAFAHSHGLKEINIPSSVIGIMRYAFYDCKSLEWATIPYGVNVIGTDAFLSYSDLTIITQENSPAHNYAVQNNIKYQLMVSRKVTLEVQDKNSSAITYNNGYTVKWFRKGTNQLIAEGDSLTVNNAALEYSYQIILGEALGTMYIQPPRQDVVFSDGDSTITYKLTEIPKVTIKGTVLDSAGEPIPSATITIHQILNGKYVLTPSTTTNTNADGEFTVEIFNDTANITISAGAEYFDRSINSVNLNPPTDGVIDLGNITISTLSRNRITLTLYENSAVKQVETAVKSQILSTSNLSFSLKKGGADFTAFKVQYPYILFDNASLLNTGDTIAINVSDGLEQMTASEVSVILDENKSGNAEIIFTRNGSFEANISSTQNVRDIAMLFDSSGAYIKTYYPTGSNILKGDPLKAGTYKLAFLGRSSLLTRTSSISYLENTLGAANFITKEFSVSNGEITVLSDINIPKLDEAVLYYTKSSATSFVANKKDVPMGTLITIRAEYEIADKYHGQTEGHQLKVTIPGELGFVPASVTVDGYTPDTPPTYEGNILTVITNKPKAVVRFCLTPVDTGQFIADASLAFTSDGQNLTQPIGSNSINVTPIKIIVPQRTGKTKVFVRGTTNPNTEVKVYDNGILVETVSSNSAGSWQAEFDLIDPYSYSFHDIHAEIKLANNAVVQSEVKELLYDKLYTNVSKITMYSYSDTTVFDFSKPSEKIISYVFIPSRPVFTFLVEFEESEAVLENVFVVTKGRDENYTRLAAVYDEKKNGWVCSTAFNTDNLPVWVGVSYEIKNTEFLLDYEMYESYRTELEEQILRSGVSAELAEAYEFAADVDSGTNTTKITATPKKSEVGEEAIDFLTYTELNYSDYDGKTLEEMTGLGFAGVKTAKDGMAYSRIESSDSSVLFTYVDTEKQTAYSLEFYGDFTESGGVEAFSAMQYSGLSAPEVAPYANENEAWTAIGNIVISYSAYLAGRHADLEKYDKVRGPIQGALAAAQITLSYIGNVNEKRDAEQLLKRFEQTCEFQLKHLEAKCETGEYMIHEIWRAATRQGVLELQNNYRDRVYLPYLKHLDNIFFVEAALATVAAITGPTVVIPVICMLAGIGTYTDLVNARSEFTRVTMDYETAVGECIALAAQNYATQCPDPEPEEDEAIVIVPVPEPDIDWFTDIGTSMDAVPIIDPSGYVYEAVESNRLQGVTATVFIQTVDDFNIPTGEDKWNAEDYGQENPLTTDEYGRYAWDVPEGKWKVKYSLEGYVSTESDWLPVPPPQTEVNIGMVSVAVPVVESVSGHPEYVRIVFDKYMDVGTLLPEYFTVTDGGAVDFELELTDAESVDVIENEETKSKTFAKTVLLKPKNHSFAIGSSVSIAISADVKSYAGTPLHAYTGDAEITQKPESLVAPANVTVNYGEEKTITARLAPGEAGSGRAIKSTTSSNVIAPITTDSVNANQIGEAEFTVTGNLPGLAYITFEEPDTGLTAVTAVSVLMPNVQTPETPPSAPTSNIAGGAVSSGTMLSLSTATAGATIFYTTDGSCPKVSVTRNTYTAPFAITQTATIIAVAYKDGLYSDTLALAFTVGGGTVSPPADTGSPGGSGTSGNAEDSGSPDENNNDMEVSVMVNGEELPLSEYVDGSFIIEIVGIDNVELTLNIPDFDESGCVITTDFGSVTISAGALDELQKKYGDNITLVIKKGSFDIRLYSQDAEIPYNDPENPLRISIPYQKEPEQKTEAIVAVDEGGNILPFGVYKNGELTFKIFSTGLYDSAYNEKEFADTNGHWAESHISFATARNLLVGIADEVFAPEVITTRAMFATVLARLENADSSNIGYGGFNDVPQNAWYASAVGWAAKNGIAAGTGDGVFSPDSPITREQMAVMLNNYLKHKKISIPSDDFPSFADDDIISPWAVDSVNAMRALGLIRGRQGNVFAPRDAATRAELATVISLLVELLV